MWRHASKTICNIIIFLLPSSVTQAGIERLLIALEPEAASLYCQNLQVERPNIGTQPLLSSVSTGTKYMVCDLGGEYFYKNNICKAQSANRIYFFVHFRDRKKNSIKFAD